MTETGKPYDVAIVGGGLAGLSLSILLARKGFSVVLFEKESYPYHKVCGEYILNESKNFLSDLGVKVDELPAVNNIMITAPNGSYIRSALPLGGFGISRFVLDKRLSEIARLSGVEVRENVKVIDVNRYGGAFQVSWQNEKQQGSLNARICTGAFGKKSNLDVKWKRDYLNEQNKKLDNYVGVKYHIRYHCEPSLIALHNFEGGYAGISEIEEGKYCFCYMTKAAHIKAAGGDLKTYERKVLARNPFLKKILEESAVLPGFPVTIAQINFQKRTQVENNVLLLGDAAGMITPLCGNGMSMALHSGKIAAVEIGQYLSGGCNLDTMFRNYEKKWRRHFSVRFKSG